MLQYSLDYKSFLVNQQVVVLISPLKGIIKLVLFHLFIRLI